MTFSQATASADKRRLRTIVAASAAGTTFEWYDFFVFGAMAAVISKNFFSGVPSSIGFILSLLTFAVGFIARPIGAIVFGHIGDKKGRKGTFLFTIVLMGSATILIGAVPSFDAIGVAAPLILVGLRVVQGFALGGEYGGAAIYVAEHAPRARRGLMTSWIQSSAGFGLIAALLAVFGTRTLLGEAAFEAWGWRLPFLASAGLLAVSVFIRAKTAESPTFQAMHDNGELSRTPLREALSSPRTLGGILVALFGLMTAQGVVWYTTFFYTQLFLERVVRLDPATTNLLVIGNTLVAAVLYLVFGALSDRIGRKPVMLFGIGLAAVVFIPGFHLIAKFANPALTEAMARSPVVIEGRPDACRVQFDPIGIAKITSPCDVAKRAVINAGAPYGTRSFDSDGAVVRIGAEAIAVDDLTAKSPAERKAYATRLDSKVRKALTRAGYPEHADPARANLPAVFAIMCVFAIAATALYGPLAAALAEMFPAKVRYTALSLPYNIGTGWFGGLLPAIAFSLVSATGDLYSGLWYPVLTATSAFVIGLFLYRERPQADL